MPSANECEIVQIHILDLPLFAFFMQKPEVDSMSARHG